MDRYYARICWNSERWQIPTGEVRSLKLEQSPSYVLTQGFGHEEWLFDFTDTLDGYQYAFLQPVHKSTALLGKAVDVILYAITPDKKRVMIAEIINLEVLTADQQAYAFAASTKIGRVARMRSELEKLGIDPRPLGISDLFNVRFKRENVCFSGEPYRELAPREHFMSLKRYSMFPALPGPIKFEQPVQETQKKELREPKNRLRRGTASVIVDDRHLRLQKALIKLLKEHYGEEHVFAERKSIDIAVRKDKQSLLIEIKSDFEVKSVIRQALGQVIEYAHWPTRNEKYETFVIVAPAAENEESRKYLAFLQDRYRIPILYCSFSVGNSLPSALRQKIVARQQ